MNSFSRFDKMKVALLQGQASKFGKHDLATKLNGSSSLYVPLLVLALVYSLLFEAIWLVRFANLFPWLSSSLTFPGLNDLYLLLLPVSFTIDSFANLQKFLSDALVAIFVTHIDLSALVSTTLMLIICKLNHRFIQRTNDELHQSLDSVGDDVRVSVLIAARNEENNIERCIRSLIDQSYRNYEILVMNDGSTDSTEKILTRLADEFKDRLNFFTNDHLPAGWYGKSWAIQCLSKRATGEILILTDADTFHNRDSIKFCANSLTSHNVDFVSGNLLSSND